MRIFFLLSIHCLLLAEIGEPLPLGERAPIDFSELEKVTGRATAHEPPPNLGELIPPEEGQTPKTNERLAPLEDLLEKRDFEGFRVLAWEAFDTWDDEDLSDLQDLALEYAVYDISLELGRRLEDLNAWGTSAFELGAYSEAYWVLLELFYNEEEPSYIVPYYLGEIFWFWERKCEAYSYFRIAKQRIEQELAAAEEEDDIIAARLTLAFIHYKEQNEIGALNNLNDLLASYPDNYQIIVCGE